MRRLSGIILFLTLGCSTTAPLPDRSPASRGGEAAYGLTVAEEAQVLALEDRREIDHALVTRWIQHPNPLHRLRIAIALGRIGPHVFLDRSGTHAGVTELASLAADPDRRVREAVAFGLGEIGDVDGAGTLFTLANDADMAVAAEAAEALSKLGGNREFLFTNLQRVLWMLDEKYPEGLRARIVRYLFRYDSPDASEAAKRALESTSAAVRQEAAYSLARKPYAPARAQLELLLTDPNTLTRAYATTALGRIGDPASARPVLNALGDAHPWVRTNAAIALGRIAEKDRSVLKIDDLPRIFAVLEDADPGVRASMIDTLGYYAETNDTALARLTNVLSNGSKWERELAAGALGKHLTANPAKHKYIPGSTFNAWQLVRFIEGSAGIPFGANVRADNAGHPDPVVRATVLANIPDATAYAEEEIIRKLMSDPDVIVRTNAYDRYAHIVTEKEETRLATLQQAEMRERTAEANDARLAAITGIGSLQTPKRIAMLTPLLEDRDPVVRRVVSDLLYDADKLRRPYTPLPVTKTEAEYEAIVRWARQPHTATIHMPRGSIELALLTQDAPMTTWNFAQLAKKGFYDNTSFMRVVPNFVIQGGDPRNDMNGGPGYAIRDEINLQKYTRGAVGMALSGPDTGGSQFFVTHSPQPHLDGGYTIFARVYDGMTGVVDQVERGDRVDRIAIDEKPPVGTEKIESVPN